MVPFVNLKVRQQYQHTRNPAIYPELFIAYRLLLFILIFNLMVYLFCNFIERKQAQLKVQAKLTDVWIADYWGTEEECLPHLLVCQSLKNPAQLLL